MSDAEKILGTDTLRKAYPKLNMMIDMVNYFQAQIDQMTIQGDSSVEAAQARVAADGTTFTTLKERLDNSDTSLAEKVNQTDFNAKFGSMGNTKTFKGSCTFAALPTSGMNVDDYWYVTDKTTNYCWNGTSWVDIGNNVNLGDKSVTVEKTNFPFLRLLSNLAYQDLSTYLHPHVDGSTLVSNGYNLSNYISFPAGTFLLYFDINLQSANMKNCNIMPALFNGSTFVYGNYQSADALCPAYSTISDKTHIKSYVLITLAQATSARISAYLSNQNTDSKTIDITVNKLYAFPLASIDDLTIKTLDTYSLLKNVPFIDYPNEYIDNQDLNNALVDYYTKEQVDAVTGQSKTISCYGDSLTEGAGDDTRQSAIYNVLQSKLGSDYVVRNMGVGGESSRTIASRQGGLCVMLNNITIPADGSLVEIGDSSTGFVANDGGQVFPWIQAYGGSRPILINDVQMNLYFNPYNDNKYWIGFATPQAQDMVINRPTAVVTDNMINHKGEILILWIGQNGGYADVDDWIGQYQKMIDYNGNNKYLVLGRTSQGSSEASIESQFYQAFGRHYINLRDYLVKYGLADAGLTPTSDDNTRIANGQVPSSLLISDLVHFNSAGYNVVSNLVYKRGKELLLW
jgi:lysophospholipase L1-like esterase